jgi:hypothetical protein
VFKFGKSDLFKVKIIFALLLLEVFTSCALKKNASENTTEDINPKIIFLNYTISKEKYGKKNIQLINKIITDGKLKNNSNNYLKIGSIEDLKCSQLNKDSIEIEHVFIKNPLSKIVEYVNDSLIFENKKLELKSAALSLRLQLNSKTKFIKISEIVDTLQNTKPLATTKLEYK